MYIGNDRIMFSRLNKNLYNACMLVHVLTVRNEIEFIQK